jgi:hypothetical protein
MTAAMPRASRCNAAAVVGSTAVAPVGHVTCSRTSRSPALAALAAWAGSVRPAPARKPGAAAAGVGGLAAVDRAGAASVEDARTKGSASNAAVWPPASVALTCTP